MWKDNGASKRWLGEMLKDLPDEEQCNICCETFPSRDLMFGLCWPCDNELNASDEEDWSAYKMDMKERLESDFTYHPPKEESKPIFVEAREKAKDFALWINDNYPHCRERSLALTKLEEVVMWANAGLARNQ